MSLFRYTSTPVKLHSGDLSNWVIDCYYLTDSDWDALSDILRDLLPPFGAVVGVPKGGLKLANALAKWVTRREMVDHDLPTLLVDDVLTTGSSMEEYRKRLNGEVIEAVVFARGPCPPWITPLFPVTTKNET